MSAAPSSKNLTVALVETCGRTRAGDPGRAVCGACSNSMDVGASGWPVLAQASVSAATARAGRVPAIGCIVGACGTARKPLASLGLGLAAALRVRFVPPLAPVAALSGTQPAPRSGARRTP
jgi:hypothetical protein